jgi:hypothetical protein
VGAENADMKYLWVSGDGVWKLRIVTPAERAAGLRSPQEIIEDGFWPMTEVKVGADLGGMPDAMRRKLLVPPRNTKKIDELEAAIVDFDHEQQYAKLLVEIAKRQDRSKLWILLAILKDGNFDGYDRAIREMREELRVNPDAGVRYDLRKNALHTLQRRAKQKMLRDQASAEKRLEDAEPLDHGLKTYKHDGGSKKYLAFLERVKLALSLEADDPAPIVWGPEISGLQAGLLMADKVAPGNKLGGWIVVRNVSDEIIDISTARSWNVLRLNATDPGGKKLPTTDMFMSLWGIDRFVSGKLAPGIQFEMETFDVAFSLSEKIKDFHGVHLIRDTKRVNVEFEWLQPPFNNDAKRLTTGAVPVTIDRKVQEYDKQAGILGPGNYRINDTMTAVISSTPSDGTLRNLLKIRGKEFALPMARKPTPGWCRHSAKTARNSSSPLPRRRASSATYSTGNVRIGRSMPQVSQLASCLNFPTPTP